MEDVDRVIGKLEEATETLKRAFADGQIESRQFLKEHALDDNRRFDKIDEALGGLRDRIVDIERIGDMVDSHAGTIADLESRTADLEGVNDQRKAASEAAQRTNAKWLAGATAAGAAAGATGTSLGPKLWKVLLSLFR